MASSPASAPLRDARRQAEATPLATHGATPPRRASV